MELKHLFWLCAGALLAGCEAPSSSSPETGICVHTYEDEVLHIDEAQGTTTGAVIAVVDFSSFMVDGIAQNASLVIAQRSRNVALNGDSLRCTLPCSFGTQAGVWEFLAVAEGYGATAQKTDADYALFQGGCPSYQDVGTHTVIRLNENM